MRRDDSSNVFLSMGPDEDEDFGAIFDEAAPRSGGHASGPVSGKSDVTLRDPGPSIESELLRLCEEAGAPTERPEQPASAPADTIPAPPIVGTDEELPALSSKSKLAREPAYDTIPAPPPSQKKEPSPSAPVLPPTLPSARVPKFA